MHPEPNESRTCRVCGTDLRPENRFCPNCGTPTTEPPSSVEPVGDSSESIEDDSVVIQSQPEQPHPSTLETRQFHIDDTPPSLPSYQEPTPPPYEASVTTVPPESGNRTLWIILSIVAAIVLVCCCLLPLGLLAVANMDTSLQDDIRSLAALARA